MNKKLILMFLALSVAGSANAISSSYRIQLERSGCTQVTDSNGTCDIHKTKTENYMTTNKDKQPKYADLSLAERTFDKALAGKPLSEVVSLLVNAGWKLDDNKPLEFAKDNNRLILDVNQKNDIVMGVSLKQ